MFARNAKWVVLFLMTALISCSRQEDILTDNVDEHAEIVTAVTVKIPEVFRSRAIPDVYVSDAATYRGESGMPSVGNVELDKHPITFTVGIYTEKTVDGASVYEPVDQQWQEAVVNDEAYFNFRLLKGHRYHIVAYADFSDKHKEHLDAISFATTLNDELSDAFFASEDFIAEEHVATILKRPFGKLRLIARDFNTFARNEAYTITDVSVTFKNQAMLATDTFNAVTGDFNYDADAPKEFTKSAKPAIYTQEYKEDKTADYAAVFTMYLPVNFGIEDTSGTYRPVDDTTPVPQSWMYPFDVTVTYTSKADGKETVVKRSFDLDIPIKRNWLTTVDAITFWSVNSNIKVSIDHRFDGFIDKVEPWTITVKNYTEFKDAISKIYNLASKEGRIILGDNIDATYQYGIDIGRYIANNEYKFIEDVKIHLDLNGKKIYTRGETLSDATKQKIHQYSQGLIAIFGSNTLIIDDSSKEGTGGIESCYSDWPIITQWRYGGNIVINAGRFICSGNKEAIYLGDTIDYIVNQGHEPSTLTINGGWFQNLEPITPDGKPSYEILINIYNGGKAGTAQEHPNAIGYGRVHLNGGSYMDFDPKNGDNVCHNATNSWVDENHTVLTETVDGHTLYTVIANETPSYH